MNSGTNHEKTYSDRNKCVQIQGFREKLRSLKKNHFFACHYSMTDGGRGWIKQERKMR